ncbi:trehalose operon repressor [Alicyclobacillus contaminans]|uniref:trehalose operon repressor n=1 Tax=Alicyclobacillus contaminans TaxID=392016 RepID=UPI0004237A55|nr:trehalose operon repressor [Alicyclobacillus contaminans]GMA50835.1 trehalose operon repressor [Alicyclobacillus contaminans]
MKSKAQRIYEELATAIEAGAYKPNSLLPSEHELMAQYEVSRGTIRAALDLLSHHGYIQRVQGKGSIVLDHDRYNFPVTGLVSFKEISARMPGRVRTVVHQLLLMQPDERIRDELNLRDNDEVWKVVRSREIDGESIILDIDYIARRYVPYLTQEICENSIYEYLENDLHLAIAFAKKEIVVETATPDDVRLLDLGEFSYVVVVKNHVYLEDTALFQYTESRHRPDKFQFVDFARRIR